MGIRLTAFAIDIPRFAALIERPVGELLWSLADQGTGEATEPVMLYEPKGPHYHARSGDGVWMSIIDSSGTLTQHPLARNGAAWPEALRASAREFISTHNSYQLELLLQAVDRCCSNGPVVRVIAPERLDWIWSFLAAAETELTTAECEQLTLLCQKLLRWRNWITPARHFRLSDFDFVVLPSDDDANEMGVWSVSEVGCVSTLSGKLLSNLQRSFNTPPATSSDLDPQAWDQYVRTNAGRLRRLPSLPFQVLNLVSFVD